MGISNIITLCCCYCYLWFIKKLGIQTWCRIYMIYIPVPIVTSCHGNANTNPSSDCSLFVCHKSQKLPVIDIYSNVNGSQQCPARLLCGLPVPGAEDRDRDQAQIKRASGGEKAAQSEGTGDHRAQSRPDRARETGPNVERCGVK